MKLIRLYDDKLCLYLQDLSSLDKFLKVSIDGIILDTPDYGLTLSLKEIQKCQIKLQFLPVDYRRYIVFSYRYKGYKIQWTAYEIEYFKSFIEQARTAANVT